MQSSIVYFQKQIHGFIHPRIRALLLERSLLDPAMTLEQAQSAFPQSPKPNTIEAYKRGIVGLGEERLPEEVYSYGFTSDEYQQNQFELDLIAAQRPGFRHDNPFYQHIFTNTELFTRLASELPNFVQKQSNFINHKIDFSVLKPIIDLHLLKSYRFGIAAFHLSGSDATYAAVESMLPRHLYASTIVCIADQLYYFNQEQHSLVAFVCPDLLAALQAHKDASPFLTSFAEFPSLFAAIGEPVANLKRLKDEMSQVEAGFLPKLKEFEDKLKEDALQVENLVEVIYPQYLDYQAKINQILAPVYPEEYLQNIKLLPFNAQLLYAPRFFPNQDLTREEEAEKLQLYIGDLVLTLAGYGRDFTERKASFALSLNNEEISLCNNLSSLKDYLAQDSEEIEEYKRRVKTWYMCTLGYSEQDYALQDELDLFTVYNIVIGRMQCFKSDLISFLQVYNVEPAEKGLQIALFERFVMSSVKPIVQAYLSGDLQKNQVFTAAASNIKHQKGNALLTSEDQASLQYFMPAFAVLPQAVIDSSLKQENTRKNRLRLQFASIAVTSVVAAIAVILTLGGLIPMIIAPLLLGVAALAFWQMNKIKSQNTAAQLELTASSPSTSVLSKQASLLQNHLAPGLEQKATPPVRRLEIKKTSSSQAPASNEENDSPSPKP